MKKPELLAPAGGMEELKAAVQGGADAVYIGGKLFNARMNAGNFDDEEMKAAVRYAHLRGVRIYVTMNTLLYDDELKDALEYAAFLYETGVDALIIQDLGLGSLIKKYIPGFELHLSTQGTVYNASGARAALKLGYSRVVAAREMSLAEISEMAKVCDTEVFVHGAICICYSGQCQLSRSIGLDAGKRSAEDTCDKSLRSAAGVRSGNRGGCAQPCRMLYEDEDGRRGYWLSPKDLCLIDRIGDLISAGVCSFKIEGRMKSPEYAAVVTSIYRKYIDLYCSTGSTEVSEEDRHALMQIFSRGEFTHGYLDGQPERFLSGDLPKHQGILIGHVLGRAHHDLVRVRLAGPLEMGDGIEIRGGAPGERKPAGNIVTYIESIESGLTTAYVNNGGDHLIGDIRGDIRQGDLVYRISSKRQLEEARELAAGENRKIPVRMKFFAIPGKKASLTVRAEMATNGSEYVSVKVESEQEISEARSKAADEEFAAEKLGRTGGTVYNVETIDIKLVGDCFLPAGLLNQMRREALELLDEERLKMERPAVDLHAAKEELGKREHDETENLISELPGSGMITKRPCGEKSDEEDGCILFPEITKGAMDDRIKSELSGNIYNNVYNGKKVIVNNLGWILEMNEAGAEVYGGSGLNVTNRYSAEALSQLGVSVVECSREMESDVKRVMITEYDLPQKQLKDMWGQKYKVVRDGGKTIVEKDE